MTQTYVFLGNSEASRLEVIADLAEGQLQGGSIVALPENETDVETIAQIGKYAPIVRWKLEDGAVKLPLPDVEADTLIVVTDGGGDLIDQIEGLSLWLRERTQTHELARIISFIDCALFFGNPSLTPWMDACIHFSDFVLFAHREGVPNKWFSDVRLRFTKLCYPCQFDFVKDGRVRNPAELLCPEARRMSLAFDFELPLPVAEEKAERIEYEIVDESGEAVGPAPDADDEEESVAEEYFERDAAGRRKIRLPALPR